MELCKSEDKPSRKGPGQLAHKVAVLSQLVGQVLSLVSGCGWDGTRGFVKVLRTIKGWARDKHWSRKSGLHFIVGLTWWVGPKCLVQLSRGLAINGFNNLKIEMILKR